MQIREALPSDDPALSQLLAAVFGPHPEQAEMLGRWLADDMLHPLVAEVDGELAGASVASLGSDVAGLYPGFAVDLEAWARGHRLGVFRMIAVHPAWRRSGVATALGTAQVRWLLGHGATRFLGVSWESGDPACSRPLFEGAGFTLLGTSADFYRRVQERTGQPCSRCGVPCSCRALLYGADRAELEARVGRSA